MQSSWRMAQWIILLQPEWNQGGKAARPNASLSGTWTHARLCLSSQAVVAADPNFSHSTALMITDEHSWRIPYFPRWLLKQGTPQKHRLPAGPWSTCILPFPPDLISCIRALLYGAWNALWLSHWLPGPALPSKCLFQCPMLSHALATPMRCCVLTSLFSFALFPRFPFLLDTDHWLHHTLI